MGKSGGQQETSTATQMFKPKKRITNKPKSNKDGFEIPHNLKIGQKVRITAEHRNEYLCFHNPDGTLNNPKYEILSFHQFGGVIIMNVKDPDIKCLVSYIHLIPVEKKG